MVRSGLGLAPDTGWAAQILSTSAAGRAVVRFDLRPHDRAPLSAVVKPYVDDSGATTAAALQVLRAAARAAALPTLHIPDVVLWEPTQRLLVMRLVEGTSYRELAGAPGASAALERLGRALAELHSLPVPAEWGTPRTLAEHAAELSRPHPLALAESRRPDTARIRALFDEVLAAERHEFTPAPLHRDLHLGQLFQLDEAPRVAVLDWDHHAPGDPALDVANLLVYLETRLGPGRGAEAGDVVRHGYTQAGDRGVLDRLRPFVVLTYLRMAAKRHRLGPSGGPLTVEELLLRAERETLHGNGGESRPGGPTVPR